MVPQIEARVLGTCQQTEGSYISINAKQRKALGNTNIPLPLGSFVEVFDTLTQEVLGVFTVGLGQLGQAQDECYINGVPEGTQIGIRPLKEEEKSMLEYPLSVQLHLEEHKKHPDRSAKIAKRFSSNDAVRYISVPTAVGIALEMPEGSRPTIRVISKINLKIGDETVSIVAVPGGSVFGMTSVVAQEFPHLAQMDEVVFVVKDGVLVLN